MDKEKYSPNVSVIIPVYKSATTIKKCIDSLLGQSLKEVEFIFIDDRGNDGSMEVVYEASKIDTRIRVFTNDVNMGPGASRNKGIEMAQGRYLSFVDSDDSIAEDFLALLYEKAIINNADVVCGKTVCLDSNGKVSASYDDQWRIDYIKNGLRLGKPLYTIFNSHHFSAIYSRTLIVNSNSRYGEWTMGEDLVFLIKVLDKAKKLEVEEKAIYYYFQNGTSLCHSFSDKTIWNDLYSFKELLEYMNENLIFDEDGANFICPRIHNLLRNIALGNVTDGLRNTSKEVLDILVSAIKASHIMGIVDYCSMEVKTLALYGYNLIYLPAYGLEEDTTILFYIDAVKRTMEFARDNKNCKDIYRYFGMNSIRETIKYFKTIQKKDPIRGKAYAQKFYKVLWSPGNWLKHGMIIQCRFIRYYYMICKEDI